MPGKVGVCVAGQLRTLMSPWVLDSFDRYVASPLVQAGYRTDVHAAVVADLSWQEKRVLHRSLRQALPSSAPLVSFTLLSINESWAPCHRFACQVQFPPRTRDWGSDASAAAPRVVSETEVTFKSMVVQYTSIRACYEQVVSHERTTKEEYTWLYRMRTDFVPLEDIPLPTLNRESVHVPFGLYPCMNDHAFVCPRQLCRAHFNVLELWESRFCMQAVHSQSTRTPTTCALRQIEGTHSMAWLLDHRHQSGLLHVANTNLSSTPPLITPDAPTLPFILPPAPIDMGPPWYWLARYTQGRTCQRGDVLGVPHCCESARLRLMSWAYAIARGHAMAGYLQFCGFGLPEDDDTMGFYLANRTLTKIASAKRRALKKTCDRLARQLPHCRRSGARDLDQGMSQQCKSDHSRLATLVGRYATAAEAPR